MKSSLILSELNNIEYINSKKASLENKPKSNDTLQMQEVINKKRNKVYLTAAILTYKGPFSTNKHKNLHDKTWYSMPNTCNHATICNHLIKVYILEKNHCQIGLYHKLVKYSAM